MTLMLLNLLLISLEGIKSEYMKYGPEKTLYLETFHAVYFYKKICILSGTMYRYVSKTACSQINFLFFLVLSRMLLSFSLVFWKISD